MVRVESRRFGSDLNHAVFDIKNAVEDIKRAVVVGDDEDAGIALMGDLGEQFHDLPTEGAVQRRGGLVREDEARVIGERTGDRNALLFTTGKGNREIVGTGCDAKEVEQFHGSFARGLRRGVIDI